MRLLSAFAGGCAWLLAAPAPALAVAPEPAADVVATRDAEGLVVRYRLSEPQDRVVFADRGILRDRWSVLTPGLVLADGAVTGDEPFEAFELRILPDAAEVDRVYMGLAPSARGVSSMGPASSCRGSRRCSRSLRRRARRPSP